MSFVEQATVALERAQQDQDCGPLNRLLCCAILRATGVTVDQLDDIRSDVYRRLVKPLNAGQPYEEIAAQLYIIIRRATIDHLRRLRARPTVIPLQDVSSESLARFGSYAMIPEYSDLDDERVEQLIKALKALRDSPKRSDRRRFIAVMAYAHNQSPLESLRQSEPNMTKYNAAQILSRGLATLRVLCASTPGKRAS